MQFTIKIDKYAPAVYIIENDVSDKVYVGAHERRINVAEFIGKY